MVWVYDRTGSLLVAMIMHVSITASKLIFEPLEIGGVSLLIYDLVSLIAMWLVVAVVVVANGGKLSLNGKRDGIEMTSWSSSLASVSAWSRSP